MAKKTKKKSLGSTQEGEFVYSTNANFAFAGLADLLADADDATSANTLEVHLEKKHRGGKAAVLIRGFQGTEDELQHLAKRLKTALGVGGSAKNGEIIVQGSNREKVMELLHEWQYKTKRVGA